MDHRFDTVAKAMATRTTRREALKWITGVLGGVLGGTPLLGEGARPPGVPGGGGGGGAKGCKAYCNKLGGTKTQKNQCESACADCNEDTSKLCGPRGAVVCCAGTYECCIDDVCHNGHDDHEFCGETCGALVACSSTEVCTSRVCREATGIFCECSGGFGFTVCSDRYQFDPRVAHCPSNKAALCDEYCQSLYSDPTSVRQDCTVC